MGVAGKHFNRGLLVLCIFALVAAGCSTTGATRSIDNSANLAKLKKVDVKVSENATTVVVVLDRPVTYTSVRVDDPPKFMLEMAGVDIGGLSGPMKVDRDPVVYITPSRSTEAKRVARLEIGLSKAADVKVIQDGDTINLTFARNSQPAVEAKKTIEAPSSTDEKTPADAVHKADVPVAVEAEKKAVPVAVSTIPDEAPITSKVQTAKAQASVKPAAADAVKPSSVPVAKAAVETKAKPADVKLPAATKVEGITCAKSGAGYEVTIAGDGSISSPKVFMLGKDRLVIDLPNISAAKQKDNATVGAGLLKGIRMAAHPGPDMKVRVVLDVAGETEYDVKGVGKSLVVTLQPKGAATLAKKLDAPASKAEPVAAPAMKDEKTVTKAVTMEADKRVVTVSKTAATKGDGINIYVSKKDGKTVLSSAPIDDVAARGLTDEKPKDFVETETKIYTGGKISFDIQDADLDKVIKLLADVAGLNLLLDPKEVSGKVTLKLDKVPWDQALDILLRIYNLDKSIEGNVLRVAPKAKFDADRKRTIQDVADLEKAKFDSDQINTRIFKLSYATVDDALNTKIKQFLSVRGDSQYNASTNELMVTDVKDYQGKGLDKAEAIIKNLDLPKKQIMIEARIITVNSDYSRTLGITWGLTRNGPKNPKAGSSNFGPSLGISREVGLNATAPAAPGDPSTYQLNVPTTTMASALGGIFGALSFGSIIQDINLDLTIQALENVNKATSLAAPKIVTMEGESATIVSGDVFYILTPSATGSSTTAINANTNLTIRPRISGENYILLDVNVAVGGPSKATPAGAVAGISTNTITTKVMVKDGDTIVLGGLFTKSSDRSEARVPLLGRLPIIGWLFKQQVYNEPNNEVLIFITPKILGAPQPA